MAVKIVSHFDKEKYLKPLRVSITNTYNNNQSYGKLKGSCIGGKVEGGVLELKKNYIIMPQAVTCTVKDILINDLGGNGIINKDNDKVTFAFPGQVVDCSLIFEKNYEFN